MPEKDACAVFLKALDPSTKEFNFRIIPEDGSGEAKIDKLHGSLDSVGYEIEARNVHCGVSVQVNQSASHSFKGEDIARIRAVWVDDDDDKKEEAACPPLPPSMTVVTSPRHYHRYWFVSDHWEADEAGRRDFRLVMQGMVEKYGCDTQAKDINRVLRLPGTWNRKIGKNHQTRIIWPQAGAPIVRYTREQLLEAFGKPVRESIVEKRIDAADYETASPDTVRSALKAIPSDDRETWLTVGMGLHHELGAEGFELWCEWSRTSEKYEAQEQSRTWKGFNSDTKANPRTIASVFAIANAYGWSPDAPSIEPQERPTTEVKIRRKPEDLTERTMKGLRLTFEGRNHRPSEQQMAGLNQAALTIQGMADGTLSDQNFYISFLAPGIGKTSTVIEAVRNLTRMSEYENVGVIIFLSRIEEIRKLVEEMGLKDDEFSVQCQERREEFQLGNQHKQQARVMFTTQQMLEKRTRRNDSFAETDVFHWNGKPRQVRIWDEAILPARPITVEDCDLFELVKPIARNGSRELADLVRTFGNELTEKKDKQQIEVPDFKATPYALESMLEWFEENSEAAQNMEALWKLSGLTVRVRKEMGAACLDYEDILPNDLGPLLILDASGKTREVYPLWANNRRGLHFLPSPQKGYNGLTIYLCNHASGRNARSDNPEFFIKTYSDAIASLPENDPILAVVHKPKNKRHDPDFEKAIGERCDNRSNLKFLTYGNHTATNEHKDCKHVMLVGVLNYSMAQNEAIGRGAMGIRTEDEFSDSNYHAIRLGEIGHHIYQAACRGQVRLSDGDHCPDGTTLWVMCPTKGKQGIPRSLFEELFPGAEVKDWNPVPKKARGHVKALNDLEQTAEGRRMTDKEKAIRLGIKPQALSRLKKHPDYEGERGRTEGITTLLPAIGLSLS